MKKEKAKLDVKDYKQELFSSCMDACVNSDRDTCTTQCIDESGADEKDKAKKILNYDKDLSKKNIESCEESGTELKDCLKTEFQNNSNKKKVIGSIKE